MFFAVGVACGDGTIGGTDAVVSADDGSNPSETDEPADSGESAADIPDTIDLPPETCIEQPCWAYDLGECDASDCNAAGLSCAFTHGGPGAPGVCAPITDDPGGLNETCEMHRENGLQTCGDGLTCFGVRYAAEGICVEWCTSGIFADEDEVGLSCSQANAVCIQHRLVDIGSVGGWCATQCNPADPSPCGGLPHNLCHDVGSEPSFRVGPLEEENDPRFVCVPTLPGSAKEREECSTLMQHHPDDYVLPLLPCGQGLTCASYQFNDQSFPRAQCLRVCDAPEDCLPTETCVSSLEFTEAVGEPVGVCEVL